MSTKSKRVTYQESIDENTDYLVPLRYDHAPSNPTQLKVLEDIVSLPSPPSNGFFASIYLPISLLLYVGIPISQLAIGLIYIGQCPVQDLIVVWMIVSGVAGILFVLLGLIIHVRVRRREIFLSSYDESQSYPILLRILLPSFLILFLFIIAWFFAGQVFVFEVKLHVEFFDPTLPDYCHGSLYKAAYILIFIDYLIFLLALILNVLSYVVPPDDNPHRTATIHLRKT